MELQYQLRLQLQHFVSTCNHLVVLSGAGLSTASGIPDYRSPGRPPHRPMQHQQFMMSDAARKRYWARSTVGFMSVWRAKPNQAHHAIAEAQARGKIKTCITQNVDGLLTLAGVKDVIELHGTIKQCLCMGCREVFERTEWQKRLLDMNQMFAERATKMIETEQGKSDGEVAERALRPDGDVQLIEDVYAQFKYPNCPKCNAPVVKPNVVFFGDTVPAERHAKCDAAIAEADGLLVVGTSLSVWSAFRLVRQAVQRTIHAHKIPAEQIKDKPMQVAIINDGPTRADQLSEMKLHDRCEIVLPAIFGVMHSSIESELHHRRPKLELSI